MPEYVFVSGDDWEALYVDGRKALEGHSIPRHDLLRVLGVGHHEIDAAGSEWEENVAFLSGYPELLGEVEPKIAPERKHSYPAPQDA